MRKKKWQWPKKKNNRPCGWRFEILQAGCSFSKENKQCSGCHKTIHLSEWTSVYTVVRPILEHVIPSCVCQYSLNDSERVCVELWFICRCPSFHSWESKLQQFTTWSLRPRPDGRRLASTLSCTFGRPTPGGSLGWVPVESSASVLPPATSW